MAKANDLFAFPGSKVGQHQKDIGDNAMTRNPAIRETRVPNRAQPGGGPKKPVAPSVPLGTSMKTR